MMRFIKGLLLFVAILFAIIILPRSIWYYRVCQKVQPECSKCCEAGFSLLNKSIVIPESTGVVRGFSYQEKYGLVSIQLMTFQLDSLKSKQLFQNFLDKPTVEIGEMSFFRRDTLVNPFVKGTELVQADLKLVWVISYAPQFFDDDALFLRIKKLDGMLE